MLHRSHAPRIALAFFMVTVGGFALGADDLTPQEIHEFAKEGNRIAQGFVGTYYHFGIKGYEKDPEKAVHWYKKASKNGYVKAQVNLGLFYLKNPSVKDKEKGMEWLLRAADNGSTLAKSNLGAIYFMGLYGVQSDSHKARPWIKEAAYEGDPNAQELYGEFLGWEIGGVEEDLPEAYAWFTLSATSPDNDNSDFTERERQRIMERMTNEQIREGKLRLESLRSQISK